MLIRSRATLGITALTALFLTGCSPAGSSNYVPLDASPDDTVYAWSSSTQDKFTGTEGEWVSGENGFTNSENGCLMRPSLLQAPPETTGKDDAETANLLAGISAEVQDWVELAPLPIGVDRLDRKVEFASATYTTAEDGRSHFLAARYFSQTGQVLMALLSCEDEADLVFAQSEGGLEAAGVALQVREAELTDVPE